MNTPSTDKSLRSMTGFGRGTAPTHGGTVVVELRAVNHKGLEVKCRLPRALLAHEPQLHRACKARLERGRVDLNVEVVKDHSGQGGAHVVDAERVAAIVAALKAVSASHPEVKPSIGGGELLSLPGVLIRDTAADADSDVARPEVVAAVDAAVDVALQGLVQAREAEGRGLVVELSRRKDGIVDLVDQIEARTQTQVQEKADKLRERLAAILKDVAEPARIVAETAALAERLDVTEEVTGDGVVEPGAAEDGDGRRADQRRCGHLLLQEGLADHTVEARVEQHLEVHVVDVDAGADEGRPRRDELVHVGKVEASKGGDGDVLGAVPGEEVPGLIVGEETGNRCRRRRWDDRRRRHGLDGRRNNERGLDGRGIDRCMSSLAGGAARPPLQKAPCSTYPQAAKSEQARKEKAATTTTQTTTPKQKK
jgi:uncharacterized protein (TIGR00255 family)